MPPKRGTKRKAEDASDSGAGAAVKVFKGLTFVLSGTLSQPKAKTEKLIKENGGQVAGSLTKAVTHVLAAAMGTGKADEGAAKGLPVLKESFLDASISGGKVTTDASHYWANAPSGDGSAAAQESKSDSSAVAMKDDDGPAEKDEGDDAEVPKKGAKGKGKAKTETKAAAGGGGKVFAGLTFCLTGTLSQKKAVVEKMIKSNGGKIAGSVTNAVTHVVAAEMGTGKASAAEEKGIPVVKESFLQASIDAGKLTTDKQHFHGDGEGGGSGDDGDDDGPAKKKQKTGDDGDGEGGPEWLEDVTTVFEDVGKSVEEYNAAMDKVEGWLKTGGKDAEDTICECGIMESIQEFITHESDEGPLAPWIKRCVAFIKQYYPETAAELASFNPTMAKAMGAPAP